MTSCSLKTSLKVKNTGSAPFAFTAALHSYFDISAVSNLKIEVRSPPNPNPGRTTPK